MALYDNRSLTLERGFKQRSRRIVESISDRFRSVMHPDEDQGGKPGGSAGNDAETVEGHLVLRFPLVRKGYDPGAVDEYVADLERELSALDHELAEQRGRVAPAEDLESQIKRVGEQTSAVLIAAHEQSEEILRTARAEADRCVAEATTTARKVTARSEARLHELEAHNEAARGERSRLLAEIRTISTALAAVADSGEGSD